MVVETQRLATGSAQTDVASMERVTNEVGTPASEGARERQTQMTIDIGQSPSMELPEGEQSQSRRHQRLFEHLDWLKDSVIQKLRSGPSLQSALARDRRLEGSSVAVGAHSQDLEKASPARSSSSDPQENKGNQLSADCRICQMSPSTDDVIELGCACKKDMGRVHAVCAVTWFSFRGSRFGSHPLHFHS
jgi:hypothetical protein